MLLGGLAISGCQEADVPKEEQKVYEREDSMNPIILSRSEQEVVYKQNEFSLEMFKHFARVGAEKNFIVSPLSLSMCMSMFANGASGETYNEIVSALGFETDDLDQINAFNHRFAGELIEVDKATQLSLANSMWFDQRLHVKEDFIKRNKEAYGAEMFTCDFTDSDVTHSLINAWVKDKTNGMIPSIVSGKFSAESVMLINALYFKSVWYEPFDKTLTCEKDFTNYDGTVSTPLTMNASDYIYSGTYDSEGASWSNIDYGNAAYQLVIIIPDEGKTMAEYMAGMTAENFKAMNERDAQLRYTGTVQLPKFEVGSNILVDAFLREKGVKKAFELGLADFSKMANEDFVVSAVKQRTVMSLDETGTVAASVSTAGLASSPGPRPSADLIVDRPFGFMIRENSTRTILFVGCVNKL